MDHLYSIGSKNLQNQQEKFWFKTSTLIEISVDKQGLYLFPIVLLNALILMGRNDLLVSLFPRICENAWQLSTSADTPVHLYSRWMLASLLVL